jgi:pantoate--beta-alanine ligase
MAASSRNARLTQEGRQAAAVIFSALKGAGSEDQLRQMLATEPLFQLDYADFIDEVDFTHAHGGTQNVRAIVAGWINGVRLIDNMRMEFRA